MKRIGIFGGTFNPIHTGHLIIAQEVLEQLNLDKVFFVPCNIAPHKIERNLAKAEDRLKMASLAIKGNLSFKVSDWEIKRKGTSYTVDTLKKFKSVFGKQVKLFFIIGADNLKDLNKWKDIKVILQLARMVVVNRPGHPINKIPRNFLKVIIPGIDISSSAIRRRVALKKKVDYFLPCNLSQFIKKQRIYN